MIFAFVLRGDEKRIKLLRVVFFALFVLMAFRHPIKIGVDSSSYYSSFLELQQGKYTWGYNLGLVFVMRIILIFTNDFQWVLIISAVWVCVAYYQLLKKYSMNVFISIMWFLGMLFYTFLFSILKQAWAMGFICYAFDAILKNKKVRFLILVGVAALFHFPALIFLPAFWIAKLRINRAFPILMLSLFVIVFVFRTQILNLMTSAYANGESEYSTDVGFFGGKVIFMALLLAFGFYQYFALKYTDDSGISLLSVLLYLLGVATVIQTFCYYSNNFERLADYYFHFSILLVPILLSRKEHGSNIIDKSNIKSEILSNSHADEVIVKTKDRFSVKDINIYTVLTIVIVLFCIWRFISYTQNDPFFTPYYFFWQK